MALTLPTPQSLQKYKDEGLSDADALSRASDLFTLATGLTSDPTDLFEKRLIRQALLDMAWSLQTVHEDMEENFSPFSGERIGSYSYTKMQQSVAEKRDTGIASFDQAVAYFTSKAFGGSAIVTDSEWVFKQDGNYDGHLSNVDTDVLTLPPVYTEATEPEVTWTEDGWIEVTP